jgi:hypothetical protein
MKYTGRVKMTLLPPSATARDVFSVRVDAVAGAALFKRSVARFEHGL